MTLYYQFFRFLILPGKFQDRIARLDKFRDKSEQPAPFFSRRFAKRPDLQRFGFAYLRTGDF